LAGPIAEARYRNRNVWPTLSTDDYARAKELLVEVATGPELEELEHSLCMEAIALMRRPDVWRAVKALADELLVGSDIGGEQAITIIDRSAGWNPMQEE
jgi:hypothetical protein